MPAEQRPLTSDALAKKARIEVIGDEPYNTDYDQEPFEQALWQGEGDADCSPPCARHEVCRKAGCLEIRTSGLMSGEGKRSVAAWPKPPRSSSTLQFQTPAAAETVIILLFTSGVSSDDIELH